MNWIIVPDWQIIIKFYYSENFNVNVYNMQSKLDNTWVILVPWFFPGDIWPFNGLMKKAWAKNTKIGDGWFNNPEFYDWWKFLVEPWIQKILDQTLKIKQECDKIILIKVSAGCGVPLSKEIYHEIDWQILLSPTYSLEWISDKRTRLIGGILSWNWKSKRVEKMYKRWNISQYWITLEDMLDTKKLSMWLSRVNYLQNNSDLLKEEGKLNFEIPTLAYYSELETQFVDNKTTFSEMNPAEKFDYFLSKIWSYQTKRQNHIWLHASSNPNIKLLKEATWNIQILTNLSHPSQYMSHWDLRWNLNPYLYLIDYLMDSIENEVDLSTDDKFDPKKIYPPHVYWVFRGMNRNIFNKLMWKQTVDREITYMVESLMKIDEISDLSPIDIIHSFIKTIPNSLYHWLTNWNNPHWHPLDLRKTLSNS